MLVFVNNIYLSNQSIKYVELVIHNRKNLSNYFFTGSFEEATQLCRSLSAQGASIANFKDNNLQLDKSCRITNVPDDLTMETGLFKETPIESVYSLFYDLAKVKALFIPNVDFYEDGFIGVCTDFSSLRVSSSSMNLVISYFDENKDSWISAKLLDSKDNSVSQNNFYCAIPNDQLGDFYKYGLEKVKEIVINNRSFTIFKYLRNLSIYRIACFKAVPEPVIIKYSNDSVRYDATLKLLKFSLKSIKKDIGLVSDELPKGSTKIRTSSVFNNKVGVFFKNAVGKSSKLDYERAYQNVITLYQALCDQGVTEAPSLERISQLLLKLNLPYYFDVAVHTLFSILFSSNGVNVKCTEVLYQCLENVKLLKLSCDMYLYSLRFHMFKSIKVVESKFGSNVFYLKSSEGSVRVEVWS